MMVIKKYCNINIKRLEKEKKNNNQTIEEINQEIKIIKQMRKMENDSFLKELLNLKIKYNIKKEEIVNDLFDGRDKQYMSYIIIIRDLNDLIKKYVKSKMND